MPTAGGQKTPPQTVRLGRHNVLSGAFGATSSARTGGMLGGGFASGGLIFRLLDPRHAMAGR